jgi:putative membrane protein
METPARSPQKSALSDYLAAERTFLAWIRTGLALMGFGFVVARFGLFLQQVQALHVIAPQKSYGLSLWFGTALIAVGIILNVFAGFHHLNLIRTLDSGEIPHSHPTAQALALALFLAAVGLAMAVYLLSIRTQNS